MMPAEFVVSRSCRGGKKCDKFGLTNGRKSVGRDIAPPEPAPITTGRIGTEMLRGVDVTAAASGRKHRRGWRPSSSNGTKNVKVCLLPLPQGSAYAHAARSGLSPCRLEASSMGK